MQQAVYRVVPEGEGWVVRHDGETSAPYVTKEAAFEAAVATIELAIAEGYGIELTVAGGAEGRFA